MFFNFKKIRQVLLITIIYELNVVLARNPTNVELLDPSYDPCLCDLTVSLCDINCCCDDSCNELDRKLFTPPCQSEVRSFMNNEIDKWFCNDVFGTDKIQEPGWFPIVCVNSMTSALLGKFYSPETIDVLIKRTPEKFLSNIQSEIKLSYNYRSAYLNNVFKTDQLLKESPLSTLKFNVNYAYGYVVKQAETPTDTVASSIMRFPQSVNLSPSCSYHTPVRYLINQGKSYCPLELDQSLTFCQPDSSIDYRNYLYNNKIIKNPTSGAKVQQNIEYWSCNPFVTGSDPTPNAQITNPVLICDSCVFTPGASLFDNEIIGLCSKETWEYSSARIKNIPMDFYEEPSSGCVLLNNEPGRPFKSGNTCSNTVVRVENLLFWRNTEITKILTRVVVTNAFYQSGTINKLGQYFELDWVYESNSTIDTESITSITQYNNLMSNSVSSMKSGLQGYINGDRLISGYKKNTDQQVDIAYKQRISTYKILNGKLCGTLSNLERTEVLFNRNISSSCVIRVTLDDLKSRCTCLRRLIFNKMNDYFAPSNFVSKNGNPNMTSFNKNDWIDIYPSVRSFKEKSETITGDGSVCPQVPYKISVNFYIAQTGRKNGEFFNEIIGTYLTYSYTDWKYACKSNRKECFQRNHFQNFEIEFEANFINVTYVDPTVTFIEKCGNNPDYSFACIQQALFTWPRDFTSKDVFYLYTVQLGLIFGFFALMIFYLMLFGCVCGC